MERDIRYVQTNMLNLAYEENGPTSGYPVVLIHGWPDDVRSWDGVIKRLNDEGFYTIAPYLRGFGPTRFLKESSMRSGQLSALGSDIVEMIKHLGLGSCAIVGHDWGARAAYIAASEYSEHISHLVAISVGYGTNSPDQSLPIQQARNYWYHWYFSLPRGVDLVRNSRQELCRFMWETWSPTWRHTTDEFNETADSFNNPDWAEITIHSYRHRWGYAEGDPRYNELEQRLSSNPLIHIPTLVLHGDADACNDPKISADKDNYFTKAYKRQLLPNIGHFPQREDPEAVAREIIMWLRS